MGDLQKETRWVRVLGAAPDPAAVAQAARVIQAGGLVAFPTETVYGLGADALNAAAVAGIFAAKGRPSHDPIIVHVSGVAALERLTRAVPPAALQLARAFWPGPLTLVLPRSAAVPDVVTAGADTVAVRSPRHPVAQALIAAAGVPIAAPSANRFSRTSPTTAQHVWDDLGGRIDLILDGGPTPVGVESTVLDLTGPTPAVLRPGGAPVEALRRYLPQVVVLPAGAPEETPTSPPASPGLLARHYAPDTPLWLVTAGPDPAAAPAALRQALKETAARARAQGRRVALLLADEDMPDLAAAADTAVSVGPAADLDQVARRLFGALRQLDALGVDLIVARDFPPQGLGLAIRDRLRRAAQQIVAAG